jgi:hypothetical protein
MTSRQQDTSTRAPLGAAAFGVMVTLAAFVALVVAGVAAADLFPATGSAAEAASDRGVWMATQAWANPVGLAGLAVLFAVAVPYALFNIRSAIGQRRDAMVTGLPSLIKGNHR